MHPTTTHHDSPQQQVASAATGRSRLPQQFDSATIRLSNCSPQQQFASATSTRSESHQQRFPRTASRFSTNSLQQSCPPGNDSPQLEFRFSRLASAASRLSNPPRQLASAAGDPGSKPASAPDSLSVLATTWTCGGPHAPSVDISVDLDTGPVDSSGTTLDGVHALTPRHLWAPSGLVLGLP